MGIETLARADHVVPPAGISSFLILAGGMGIAGERMQDQDRIALGVVQCAVGLVRDVHGCERGATVEGNRIKLDNLGLGDHSTGTAGLSR